MRKSYRGGRAIPLRPYGIRRSSEEEWGADTPLLRRVPRLRGENNYFAYFIILLAILTGLGLWNMLSYCDNNECDNVLEPVARFLYPFVLTFTIGSLGFLGMILLDSLEAQRFEWKGTLVLGFCSAIGGGLLWYYHDYFSSQ